MKVTLENQREFRSNELGGRFVPPSELAALASSLSSGMSQYEVADQVGIPQSRVSEAFNAKNIAAAIQIIEHFAPGLLEGPLYYVPEALDDMRVSPMEHLPDDEL